MNQEPKKTQDCEDQDEITLAKDIFDEIVEETESEDWDKEEEQENASLAPANISTKP